MKSDRRLKLERLIRDLRYCKALASTQNFDDLPNCEAMNTFPYDLETPEIVKSCDEIAGRFGDLANVKVHGVDWMGKAVDERGDVLTAIAVGCVMRRQMIFVRVYQLGERSDQLTGALGLERLTTVDLETANKNVGLSAESEGNDALRAARTRSRRNQKDSRIRFETILNAMPSDPVHGNPNKGLLESGVLQTIAAESIIVLKLVHELFRGIQLFDYPDAAALDYTNFLCRKFGLAMPLPFGQEDEIFDSSNLEKAGEIPSRSGWTYPKRREWKNFYRKVKTTSHWFGESVGSSIIVPNNFKDINELCRALTVSVSAELINIVSRYEPARLAKFQKFISGEVNIGVHQDAKQKASDEAA